AFPAARQFQSHPRPHYSTPPSGSSSPSAALQQSESPESRRAQTRPSEWSSRRSGWRLLHQRKRCVCPSTFSNSLQQFIKFIGGVEVGLQVARGKPFAQLVNAASKKFERGGKDFLVR